MQCGSCKSGVLQATVQRQYRVPGQRREMQLVNIPAVGGTNLSPAWAPSGREFAYSSSRTGDPEIVTQAALQGCEVVDLRG